MYREIVQPLAGKIRREYNGKNVKGGVRMAIRPGRWRHFKGKEYQVLDTAIHSETLEEMVVYRPLYGEGKLWVRPAAMWEEMVERDGVQQPRFVYVGER